MAQYYVSLANIIYGNNSKTAANSIIITGFSLNVLEKLPTTLAPIEFLMDTNFKLFINNVEEKISTDWNLINLDSNGNYILNFNSPKTFAKEDYVIITINRGQNISNKLFIDFNALTNNSGQYTIENYTITTPGTYYFVLDNVDGIEVNKKSKYAYTFVAQ